MNNLIGYNWKNASDGKIIEVTNPATGNLIDTVPNCSIDDVNEAVRVAKIEQKNGQKFLCIKEQIAYIGLWI